MKNINIITNSSLKNSEEIWKNAREIEIILKNKKIKYNLIDLEDYDVDKRKQFCQNIKTDGTSDCEIKNNFNLLLPLLIVNNTIVGNHIEVQQKNNTNKLKRLLY